MRKENNMTDKTHERVAAEDFRDAAGAIEILFEPVENAGYLYFLLIQ